MFARIMREQKFPSLYLAKGKLGYKMIYEQCTKSQVQICELRCEALIFCLVLRNSVKLSERDSSVRRIRSST